jgi:energy-coupling factor transporter ATP-binding protein EcfA2
MRKITRLTICNYRAFYNAKDDPEKYCINIPNGENLLIYGENGSGKSSFFNALYDIIRSSNERELDFQNNIHINIESPQPEVEITISEKVNSESDFTPIEDIVFNDSASTSFGNGLLTNASANFLTYRDILKTYFLEIDNRKTIPNLFNLIIERLLKNSSDSSTGETLEDSLQDLEDSLESMDEAIKNTASLPDASDVSKTLGETKGNIEIQEEIIASISTKISDFNLAVTSFLDRILSDVNFYLENYFKANIEVSLDNKDQYISLKDNSENYHFVKNLYLKIRFFNNDLESESYHVFLNEARLSALAICIYLAAIKQDQNSDDNLRLIFLDDIFIGLDTSNRIPLLEILNRDFRDTQVMITTYDHNWYEIACNWFDSKNHGRWKFLELYTDDYSNENFEIPKLIEAKDSLASALFYYRQSDYPAAGNYLRKACERTLKKILPPICLKGNDGIDFLELHRMIESAIFFFHVIDDSTDELERIIIYLKSLMNPLSHYDVNVSIFRRELRDIETSLHGLLLKDYSRTKFKKILTKGTLVKLTYQVRQEIANVYEIILKDDLWIYQHEGDVSFQLGKAKCRNENLYEIRDGSNGEIYHNNLQADSLKEFYDNVIDFENKKDATLNLQKRRDYESLYEFNDGNGRWDDLTSILAF